MGVNRTKMLLEVKGVSKNFGGLRALADVDMSVDEGSIIGLIGPVLSR